ncbi:GTP-binding protein [Citrobacter sp. RHBSTW-00696]|nr:GTP-binding protein [Citrobacter sp. RHBSTW-00089]MBD9974945.1 hypothetical protein [Citrobacter braakii]QLR26452.1 GTP-binding protein [Citrobacter sp. RHBSTW-01013]QLU53588.1 GTP-binding protein [Citrobacter sp. RHBSTW-00696]MBJ8953944.1 GTP-binding protein [Citrobacter braakii]
MLRVTQKAADRHFGYAHAVGYILKYGSFLFHRPEALKRDRFPQFTTDVREPLQRKKGVFYCEKYTKSFELHQGGDAVNPRERTLSTRPG